jgi:hypothetical protein
MNKKEFNDAKNIKIAYLISNVSYSNYMKKQIITRQKFFKEKKIKN